jgi:flagellar protein FliS
MMPAPTLKPPAPPAALQRSALAEYGRVSLEARVASASPHMLVAMLFDRLAQTLATAQQAVLAGDAARRFQATERALAIVDGLDATLDDERGGTVARRLHAVYALMRDRLLAGQADGLAQARHSAESLAEAWRAIAPKVGNS